VVLHGLLSAGHLIEERLNAAIEPHGLSLPKLAVLENLAQAGEPLPLGVLSERLGCVRSNITQLVDRLEADRLVRRVPDPQDRRSVLAALTDDGLRRYEVARQAAAEAEREILGRLSADEREQLAALLGRFG
jgi:DNA-binding MarR family transcriptional regulator